VVLPVGNDLVDDLDVGVPPALGLLNLLRVTPALRDEVVHVQHDGVVVEVIVVLLAKFSNL
jgi:hypothetical protein